MKLFDFNNPRHIEILREELSKLKQSLRESDEARLAKDDYADGLHNIMSIKRFMENDDKYVKLINRFLLKHDIADFDLLTTAQAAELYELCLKLMHQSTSTTELNPYNMPGGRSNNGWTGD